MIVHMKLSSPQTSTSTTFLTRPDCVWVDGQQPAFEPVNEQHLFRIESSVTLFFTALWCFFASFVRQCGTINPYHWHSLSRSFKAEGSSAHGWPINSPGNLVPLNLGVAPWVRSSRLMCSPEQQVRQAIKFSIPSSRSMVINSMPWWHSLNKTWAKDDETFHSDRTIWPSWKDSKDFAT